MKKCITSGIAWVCLVVAMHAAPGPTAPPAYQAWMNQLRPVAPARTTSVAASTIGRSQMIDVPGFHLSQDMRFGTKFQLRITNRGTTPAEFIIRMTGDDREDFSLNQSHIRWLLGHITAGMDSDAIRLLLIQTELEFVKSGWFTNDRKFVGIGPYASDSTYARAYGLNSCLGSYFQQCGDSWNRFYTDLVATGWFTHSDFTSIYLTGHVFGEVQWRGRGILADPDNGMYSGINHNPASPNGFASYDDVVADTSLLEPYQWVAPSGDRLTISALNREQYISNVTTPFMKTPVPFTAQPYRYDGTIILPPGSSMTFYDTTGFIIDLVDSAARKINESILELATQETQSAADSVVMLMAIVQDTTEQAIIEQIENPLNTWYINRHAELYPTKKRVTPTLQVSIPSTAQPLSVGTQIKCPGFVRGVSGGMIAFPDTVTNACAFDLWGNDDLSPTIPYQMIHFLDAGTITTSGNQSMIVDVAFNPMLVWNPFQPASLDPLGQDDTLVIEQWINDSLVYTNYDSLIAYIPEPPRWDWNQTGIDDVSKPIVRAYPNPADQTVAIETMDDQTVTGELFDGLGRKIQDFQIIGGNSQLNVSTYVPGVYLARTPQGAATIVVIH